MKKLLLIVFASSLSYLSFSQQSVLDDFNRKKQQINKTGFIVLGSWATANVIYGVIASSQTQGADKYFHQMNAIWNGINLGFVAFGYFGATRNKAGSSFAKTLQKQSGVEKTFLFNAGLDIAYVAGGLYLKERSKNIVKNHDKLKGYGESVMLQGAVLFLFDGIMCTIHSRHGKQLSRMVEKVQLTASSNGFGLLVKL